MTSSTRQSSELACARGVAAEDLRSGDWISVLSETQEDPAWLYDRDGLSRDTVVRVQYLHSAGTPLRVEAICLPFVLTRTVSRVTRVLDVRLCEFGRLSKEYVRRWKKMNPTA